MRPHVLLLVGLLLLESACACAAAAQAGNGANDPRHVDATQFGERVTLGPNWLFAAGDNPAWASPTFDDSAWVAVSTQKNLFDYGYHDIRYAWYRTHIHLRPGVRNLMVGLSEINASYEVYANGLRIGGNGSFPPGYYFHQYRLVAFSVPDRALTSQGDLVLAIRFALNQTGSRGHGTSTPLQGVSNVYLLSSESAGREAFYANSTQNVPRLILAGLSLLAGVIALALFIALRQRREYLAAAVYMLAWGTYYWLALWVWTSGRTIPHGLLLAFFNGLGNAAIIEFVRLVLGLRRTRWIIALQAVYFFAPFSAPLTSTPFWPYYFGFVVFYFPRLFVDVLLAAMLVRAMPRRRLVSDSTHELARGSFEARILLPAILLLTFTDYWNFFNYVAFYIHITPVYRALPPLHIGAYEFSPTSLGEFFAFITVLLFLVLRTVGIARRHAKINSELEAARTVQQVLIPDEIPAIPGFTIQSAYKPAGEVGGDFFQILPTPGGGVLAVIGDVSGKGMPAAMTVSLLVGTVRTLVHYTQSPGEILVAMNQRMLSRSNGGFTTCLVLRADPDGMLTVANAGHLAPYLGGTEMALENGLPLGISADSTYPESKLPLPSGQQITLYTDGVVEARDNGGALFGFERAAGLSGQSAEGIAQAAQAFGQDDDITVLTVASNA